MVLLTDADIQLSTILLPAYYVLLPYISSTEMKQLLVSARYLFVILFLVAFSRAISALVTLYKTKQIDERNNNSAGGPMTVVRIDHQCRELATCISVFCMGVTTKFQSNK